MLRSSSDAPFRSRLGNAPAIVPSRDILSRDILSRDRKGASRALIISTVLLFALTLTAQSTNQLRFCLRADPKTFNPLLVEDENSETVFYLTAGVLIRLNRYTQELEG